MAAKSLQELFVEELRDIYDAEKRLTKALPKMAKAATSEDLQEAFTSHLRETEGQIDRLDEVFRSLGEKPRGKKCDGMIGLIEEGQTHIEELDGAVLDAALTAGAQKVEHYEISAYGTLAFYAELLGHEDAKALLGETLEEEKAADEKLTEIARDEVNRRALMGEESDDEAMAGMRGGGRSSARRGMELASANDRGGARRRSSTAGRSSSRRRASSSKKR